jgi:hypothetical protein
MPKAMPNKPKILFVIGSPNQTTQMFAIYRHLKDDFDCWFTQFFPDKPWERATKALGLVENTIMSGRFKKKGEQFVQDHGLQYDYRGEKNFHDYALVFLCTDSIFPRVAARTKSIWVQEGMIDPIDWWGKLVKKLGLPGYMALRTSLNGSMNAADIYCAASEGYKNFFTKMGTEKDRIVVTGMPNFDDCAQFLNNDFPYKDYVLVCTSDIRETFKREDRPAFIKQCVDIAAGRPLVFKLHPNEIWDRAYKEIMQYAPEDTLVFQKEDTNHMIANCQELITQYSTVVYVGMALGKKVHSYFDVDELRELMPLQNGGTSAQTIAQIGREYIAFEGSGAAFLKQHRLQNSPS